MREKQIATIRAKYGSSSSISFAAATTKIASIVGIAISFLVARLICCYRTIPNTNDDDDIFYVHECTFLSQSTTCTKCSIESYESSASSSMFPCCTVGVCFIGFRALPVISTILFTPFLALSLGTAAALVRHWFHRTKMRYENINDTSTHVDAIMVPNENGTENRNEGQEQGQEMIQYERRQIPSEDRGYPVTIEFRRPSLDQIFDE